MKNTPTLPAKGNANPEIVFYQPDETIRLEVRMEEDTVWLTANQIAELFNVQKAAISKHIKNIYTSEELYPTSTVSKMETVQQEGNRIIRRWLDYYNIDMILAIGYRVNSRNASLFRQWATQVLKDYIFKRNQITGNEEIFRRLTDHDIKIHAIENQIGLFIQNALPPTEGIFYGGQVFDAYVFVSDLIKTAQKRIILIDNYIDESVLTCLDKRNEGVSAHIYTMRNLLELSKTNFLFKEL